MGHQAVCQEHEIKGYPTLAYFRNGAKMETYKGARTLSELKDFVNTEEAETKSGVAFVKFFAPWCGHCKRMAPTWEELAKKFQDNSGVVIGHVDCTAADNINRPLCDAQGVNGFPTLQIYKDGVKAEEYNGKRELAELAKFVEKHLVVEEPVKEEKDEL